MNYLEQMTILPFFHLCLVYFYYVRMMYIGGIWNVSSDSSNHDFCNCEGLKKKNDTEGVKDEELHKHLGYIWHG